MQVRKRFQGIKSVPLVSVISQAAFQPNLKLSVQLPKPQHRNTPVFPLITFSFSALTIKKQICACFLLFGLGLSVFFN